MTWRISRDRWEMGCTKSQRVNGSTSSRDEEHNGGAGGHRQGGEWGKRSPFGMLKPEMLLIELTEVSGRLSSPRMQT